MTACRQLRLHSILGLMSLSLSAQAPETLRMREARITEAVLRSSRLNEGLDVRHALRIAQESPDAEGITHMKVQQYFNGLPVLGGEMIVRCLRDGGVETTADRLARNIMASTEPSFSTREAMAIAHQTMAPEAPYLMPPATDLVIYPVTRLVPKEGVANPHNAEDFEEELVRYELAYHIHAEMEHEHDTRHEDLLIQAHTGEVLKRWSTLHTTATTGSGKSQFSGTVSLGTNSVTGGFTLQDPTRANNYTTNMANGTAGNGTLYQAATNTSWGDGANYVPAQGSTSPNGQTAAVDAHYGMQVTWDFLKNILGRNGIDGTGRTTFSRVHYGSKYDNAFWSDGCFCMTYGDGNVFKTLVSLDVAAHEMAHGVCSSTAKLVYSGESGGLNEANSDIFATMVEFYAYGAAGKGTVIPATGGNWTMGEQLATPSYPRPMRYMQKPSLDGRSPDAWSSTLATLDVHYSSGPMNRAFYFLSQGASTDAANPAYSSYLKGGMKGLGNDMAMRVWWRTLSTRLTSTSNYLAARNGAIAAAKELYGPGSAAEIAVWNAFSAINVGTAWVVPDTTAPTVSATATGTTGTVTFTANAADNKGVTKVDFFVDGTLKGTATAPPYTFAFNSRTVANGSHTLVAKASDAAGNVGTSATVPFTTSNDLTAPTVTAKIAGSGSLTFTATATDNKGVVKVEYYVDGALKGTATASPYTFAFNATTLTNGSHALIAKAYDAAGNVGTSAAVSFTVVSTDTTAPTVSAKVTGTSGTLTFNATATDNKGVTRVDYYVDGMLKGSSTAAPYPLSFNSTPLTNANHTLVAKAFDASGNVGTSTAVTFTVNNLDKTAPVIAAKVTGSAGTISFSATATDNKAVTKVDYYVDGALKGSTTISPYTLTLDSKGLSNGGHTLIAKAFDAAGNIGTSASVAFTISNAATATSMIETESNNTTATANVAMETTTSIKGALASGSDVDTFKIPLVAGKTTRITLTVPVGAYYGLRVVQGFAPTLMAEPAAVVDSDRRRSSSHPRQLTFTMPTSAVVSGYATIQIYSVNGVVSTAQYTLTIQR